MYFKEFLRNHWKSIVAVVFLIIFIHLVVYDDVESFMTDIEEVSMEQKKSSFDKHMKDFRNIFPNGNRNAGGPQYFKYIVDMNLSKSDFELYNSFYCGVSGSPIDPQRTDAFDYLVVDDLQGNKMYGKYWRCCWPCVCDVTKYAKVETHTAQLKDGPYTHHVLTIGDPCSDQSKIPPSVSSFTCSNQTTQNGIRTASARLSIVVLYDVVPYTNQNITNINDMCRDRNSTPPDQLQGGMGDIFVKLALINP